MVSMVSVVVMVLVTLQRLFFGTGDFSGLGGLLQEAGKQALITAVNKDRIVSIKLNMVFIF